MSGIHRLFTTRRDRRNRSRQGRDENTLALSQPLFKDFFSAQMKPEESQEFKDKVKSIEKAIKARGITTLEEPNVIYALRSTKEDEDEALRLLLVLKDSIEGVVREYTPSIKLLGAENRAFVTCYLDALLFAMFARLDCFEPILYTSFDDEPRQKLVTLLRFWVNLLRSGKLITTNITKHIQDALAECGWKEACMLRQQDASEAFTFITEKLDLPLLTLKMDIYHPGKEHATDDHKFINERLLEVALPPEHDDGKYLTLEDCLEAYFNNRIEVKRYKERKNTLTSTRSMESLAKGATSHVEEIDTTPNASPIQSTYSFDRPSDRSSFTESGEDSFSRKNSRRESIVRDRFIPDSPGSGNLSNQDTPSAGLPRRRGTFVKEVMMPAWQFFRLLPWYTDNTPTNDAQVAAHFSTKRPILGLSLKRYSFLPNGTAKRLETYVDIPTEIGLPHFIQDDNMDADAPIYGNFKLSLQAMVCHRGHSVDSGHYISIVRGTSPNTPVSSSSDSSGNLSRETPRHWMRFDDLAQERVTLIDIEQALKSKEELPYLLFYQILPIAEDAAMTGLVKTSSSGASDATLEGDLSEISRKLMSFGIGANGTSSTCDSDRPSFEITAPDDNWDEPFQKRAERPASVTFTESSTPYVPPPRSMPASSPKVLAAADEETGRGFPFNRRGSRATKSTSGSRAASQSGEHRLSSTFSRLGFPSQRLSKDKLMLDGEEEETDNSTVDVEEVDEAKLGPPHSTEGKEKTSRGRTKDRGSKGKNKEKSKEKSKEKDRKLERECTVM